MPHLGEVIGRHSPGSPVSNGLFRGRWSWSMDTTIHMPRGRSWRRLKARGMPDGMKPSGTSYMSPSHTGTCPDHHYGTPSSPSNWNLGRSISNDRVEINRPDGKSQAWSLSITIPEGKNVQIPHYCICSQIGTHRN